MGQQKSPHISSDKLIWSQIYRTLKEMLKSQQSQKETLINDREFLKNSACIQHEHWSSRERFLQFQISQMKNEQAKTRLVEDAKTDLLIGFKESEALCYKTQLELADNDLEDFRSCLEVLCAENEELKEKLKRFGGTDAKIERPGASENSKGENQLTFSLKKEIKKLKHAYRELSLRRDAEISALFAEKNFVWNQFRKMESDYIALSNSKHTETDRQAREAAKKLQDSVEKLQQEINKKDEIIIKLEAERSILELDVRKHVEEARQANNEINLLRTDIDELRLVFMKKEKEIDNLRKGTSNLVTDLKTRSFENSIPLKKIKSEGKLRNCSTTLRPIHLHKCSRKRDLESCDVHSSQKPTNSCGVTCETSASDNNVHKSDQNLTEKKMRFRSQVEMRASLFHSDFKVPKLKKSKLFIP